MIAKKVYDKRVYPRIDSHDILKSKLRYVDIRVAWKEKTIDVGVYLDNGNRLKVHRENWKDGKVYKGIDLIEVNDINHRIDTLTNNIVTYIAKNGTLTKQLIEQNIYGSDFIDKHKKKRTSNVSIPIIEVAATDYLRNLWKEFPRQKIKTISTSSEIDIEGFQVLTNNEVEIIKDQISLEDFPNNLPKPVYENLAREFEREKKVTIQTNDDSGITSLLLKYYAEQKFYKQIVSEIIQVDKETINAVDHKQFIDEFGEFDRELYDSELLSVKQELDKQKRKKIIKSLSSEKRFEEGFKYINGKHVIDNDYFDPKNIIHLFALCRFGKKYNHAKEEIEKISNYDNIWKSILDYWINVNPSTDVKDFDIKWVNKFLKDRVENGYIIQNYKFGSDPFNLNKEEYIGKERKEYGVASFSNLCKWIKDYIKQLYLLDELIPHDFSGDISSVNYHKFHAASEFEAKYYILPNEFLTVFNAKDEIDKIDVNTFLKRIDIDKKETISKTVEEGKETLYYYALSQKVLFDFDKVKEILIRTSHLFVCQTLLGALRISDFNNTDKTKFRQNQSYAFIKFNQQKTKSRVQNPILEPVMNICNKFYNGELPPRFSYGDYNKYLKLLFKILELGRPFLDQTPALKGGYNESEEPLYDAITNRFARSTFVALMTANGVPDKEIMKWTGHKSYTIFLTHYQPILEDTRLKSANAIVNKMFAKYPSTSD